MVPDIIGGETGGLKIPSWPFKRSKKPGSNRVKVSYISFFHFTSHENVWLNNALWVLPFIWKLPKSFEFSRSFLFWITWSLKRILCSFILSSISQDKTGGQYSLFFNLTTAILGHFNRIIVAYFALSIRWTNRVYESGSFCCQKPFKKYKSFSSGPHQGFALDMLGGFQYPLPPNAQLENVFSYGPINNSLFPLALQHLKLD